MKIIITGASGFVGRQLVPRLVAQGVELLLVGRDPKALAGRFPGRSVCAYGEIGTAGKGFNQLLHLAVLNNDQTGASADFEAANVTLTARVLAEAQTAGVEVFIYVSTVQALTDRARTDYARSKRQAQAMLEKATGITVRTFYLPLVYGDSFGGRLSRLNRMPRPLQRLAFPVFAALKPVLHVDRLCAHILSGSATGIISDGQRANPVYPWIRRAVDLVFALTVIIGFWWVLLLIWCAIRLTSAGPGIFAQERVGQTGAVFVCYKFRTMKPDTRQAGTHDVDQAAVTGVGAMLRRTKLDELPQVWNILRGELSLIGPRPCLPMQTELVKARRALGVLDIRPGISGLAQIEDIDMSNPQRLARRDADYARLQSLLLDLKIMIATFVGHGRGDRTRRA